MSGNDPARELLDRIADGAAIDWNEPVGIDPALLEAAHTFERVRDAYRRIGTGEPREPALFHWGPLLVLERTAAGATGEIYRAWDPGLSSMVALKLLRPEAAAAGLTNREFLREAKMLAQIGQHNVLRVYGAAVHDGRPGLWAEWIEGRTLADIIATDGPIPGDDAARITAESADALAAIHAAGLTHGDVKASNVMHARDERIVLTDLGAGGDADAALHTQATPAYLSPEARAGGTRGPRDDLYALGVLLHFLLTGHYPDNGASRVRELAPRTPARLAAVVSRALHPDPARRFADARHFAAALGNDNRAARRGRWLWPMAAAAMLALALAAYWWQSRPAPWQPQAELLRRTAGGAETLRDGAVLRNGDRLDLRVSAPARTWAYVLNEDAENALHVLFPVAGLDRVNPLPAGETVTLPGAQGSRSLSWEIAASNGRDEFVLVLARAPIAALEQRLPVIEAASVERGVRHAVPDAPVIASMGSTHLQALLREVGDKLDDPGQVRVFVWRLRESTEN
jgi:tRNA A-37 threonylcarbamoyl transferase component Bud32